MYALPSMLDMTKVVFPTPDHRKVAEICLIGNFRYTNLDDLVEGAKIIVAIPHSDIKKVSVHDLIALGIML